MRPKDLLERARRMMADREAAAALEAGDPVDLARVPPHKVREWMSRNVVIQYVDPDGTVAGRVRLADLDAAYEGDDPADVTPDV